jgi:hypothetical protein
MPDDADPLVDELYALPPSEFTAARDARAAELRPTDPKRAAQLKQLRRPTVAVWLAHQLIRREADRVGELIGLGDRMRAAQASRAGDELRQLSSTRNSLIAGLLDAAAAIAAEADLAMGPQARAELQSTLLAASVDAAAVEAFANAPRSPRPGAKTDPGAKQAKPTTSKPDRNAELRSARERLRAAERDAAVARKAATQREREAADLRRRMEAIRAELNRLDDRRLELRHEELSAGSEIRRATAAQQTALRDVQAADSAVEAAKADVDRLAARKGS